MRLIDLDELLKFPIRLDKYDKKNGNEHFVFGIETVLEYAGNLPTIDAVSREKYEASEDARHILVEFADDLLAKLKERVEVVRCEECKHWNITSDGFGECEIMDKQILGNEYCSFGEWKTNGNNYNPTLTTDVTRCSECKYYIENTCAITNEPQQEEHFCSWGSGE